MKRDLRETELLIAIGEMVEETFRKIVHLEREVERIDRFLHRHRINLTAVLTKDGVPVSVIKPLDVPTGFNVAFSTNYTDASGNPATPPNPLTWTTTDPTVIALTVAADGLSALGTRGNLGTATVSVTDGISTDSEICNVVNAPSIGLSSKLIAQ